MYTSFLLQLNAILNIFFFKILLWIGFFFIFINIINSVNKCKWFLYRDLYRNLLVQTGLFPFFFLFMCLFMLVDSLDFLHTQWLCHLQTRIILLHSFQLSCLLTSASVITCANNSVTVLNRCDKNRYPWSLPDPLVYLEYRMWVKQRMRELPCGRKGS